MKGKAIIPLLLGLAVGVAAVKLAVDTIRKAQAAGQSAATIRAVRAKRDIDPHEAITAEMVELVETTDSLFAPARERIETLEGVVGRVTAKSIPAGAAVLHSMLAPPGTPPGLVGRIPPGFRAVSVKIDEVTGVAYQLKPGDWVDVIVVMDIATSARQRKETIAEVILQHVMVAAIGHTTRTAAGSSPSKVKPAKSATILVREEDVPKLHLAATRGKITLAMRGDDDGTTAKAPSATMSDVLALLEGAWGTGKKANGSDLNKPITAKRPPWADRDPGFDMDAPHSVLVVHGSAHPQIASSVERITFANPMSPRIVDVSPGLPSRAASSLGMGRSVAGGLQYTGSARGAGGHGETSHGMIPATQRDLEDAEEDSPPSHSDE